MRTVLKATFAALLVSLVLPAAAQEKKLAPVRFTLNWLPTPDHAGYYAAKVGGIYEKYGLDVEIRPGGPQVNVHQLLAARQTDMIMGTTMRAFNARREGIPIVTVASWYQKDATTFMLHPDNKAANLADLKANQVMIPNISKVNYWPWLKAKFGYSDDQLKPYDFAFRAWAVNPQAISQGYITSDKPNMSGVGVPNGKSILLADFGWDQYINTVDVLEETIAARPEVIRAFLKATAEGWRQYLKDPTAVNAELNRLNPDLSKEAAAYGYEVIKTYKLLGVSSADEGKIGAISDARLKAFADEMVKAGALQASDTYQKSYTLMFMDAL
jgi:NitT/TauT family transport system substrate-binding protein